MNSAVCFTCSTFCSKHPFLEPYLIWFKARFLISWRIETSQTLKAICSSVWSPLQWKKIFIVFRWNCMFWFCLFLLLFVTIISRPANGHYWEKALDYLFLPSHQVFIRTHMILLNLLQADECQLWQHLTALAPIPSLSLCPYSGTAPVSTHPSYAGETKTGHKTTEMSTSASYTGTIPIQQPASNALPNKTQDAVELLCHESIQLAHGQFAVH